MHDFARSERLPSYFMNRIQDFLSGARTEFNLQLKDAVTVRVVPTTLAEEICCICIQGRWRFRETAVERVHPGGGAGTYDIWAVATDQKVVEAPKPFTDETDYSFDLRITAHNVNPAGAGVEIFERVGEVEWDGKEITALRQTLGAVSGAQVAPSALSSAGPALSWSQEPSGAWRPALKQNAVGSFELADGSVDMNALIDLAVTTAKYAALSITEGKLAANSVATAKIIDFAVTAAKLAEKSVGAEKLADLAVVTGKLAELAVTEAKLADGAVTSRKNKPTGGRVGLASEAEINSEGILEVGKLELTPAVTSKLLLIADVALNVIEEGVFRLSWKVGATTHAWQKEKLAAGERTMHRALWSFHLPAGETTTIFLVLSRKGAVGKAKILNLEEWQSAYTYMMVAA